MALTHTRAARQERLFTDRMHTFDLPALIRELRSEPEYREYGRSGMTLVKTGGVRVLIEVLQPGCGLPPHSAPGPITFQVLEGEIRFTSGSEVATLRAGEILSLPAGEHDVEAVTESAFLLTIAPAVERGCSRSCGDH